MQQTDNIWVVIPAAGVGRRMKSDTPKQYMLLNDKPVIAHTLSCFDSHPEIKAIVVAISRGDEYWPALDINFNTEMMTAEGGSERCHSVLNGLDMLATHADENDWVLVHDAARPCLSKNDLNHLIDSVRQHETGGVLAIPVRDTMKRQLANTNEYITIDHTVDREGLWHALTPQMFKLGKLRDAIQHALDNKAVVTDEASAMEYAGYKPLLVEGQADNIKITRPEDLSLAEFFLKQHEG